MSDILVGHFTASKQLNQIQIANHGLLNGDTVRFELGATGNALPTPLVAGTWYYVVNAASDTFQVALTVGAVPIVLTDTGTGSNEAWSPAPTANVWAYEILTSENTFTPDVTEVNWYAQRGWELMDMQQIGGGATTGRFWYLLKKQEAPSG